MGGTVLKSRASKVEVGKKQAKNAISARSFSRRSKPLKNPTSRVCDTSTSSSFSLLFGPHGVGVDDFAQAEIHNLPFVPHAPSCVTFSHMTIQIYLNII